MYVGDQERSIGAGPTTNSAVTGVESIKENYKSVRVVGYLIGEA